MAEAGWYPDPQGLGQRWWDGAQWTGYTSTDAPATTGPGESPLPAVGQGYVDPAPYPVVTPGSADPAAAPHPQPQPDPWAAAQVAAVHGGPAASAPWPNGQIVPAALPPAPPVGVWRGPVDDRPWVQNLADAVRVVLHKYVQFDGRAGRPEFWYWTLAVALAYVALLVCAFIPFVGFVALPVLGLGGLAVVVPGYAVLVRRLRDAGFHWAWVFLALAPFGGIALLIMCAQPSKYA